MTVAKQNLVFLSLYQSRMHGVLRWPQWDAIWQNLNADDGWYLYEIGAELPGATLNEAELKSQLIDIDQFLREEHDADYCGVVYTDDLNDPSLLKIYHPRKMGASCGSSGSTVLPKWTLSKTSPIDLVAWLLEKDDKPAWWKQMLKVG
ncbi:MAG: hypothetical protein V3V09_05260 [Arenicellales bacterium]